MVISILVCKFDFLLLIVFIYQTVWWLQSCTRVQISRLDPTDSTHESRDPSRPDPLICVFLDPTRPAWPVHNGKSCKTNNELKLYSLLCAHCHELQLMSNHRYTRVASRILARSFSIRPTFQIHVVLTRLHRFSVAIKKKRKTADFGMKSHFD